MGLKFENYCILSLYLIVFLTFIILLLKSLHKLIKFLKLKILYTIKPFFTIRDLEMDMIFLD